jgi:hypothetical protein
MVTKLSAIILVGCHCIKLHTNPIQSNILLSRLGPYINENIGDHQCGFRLNKSTADEIFCIHEIMEKNWEYNETVHQLFIDLTFWRLNVFYIQYKNSVRTSRETHYVSATNINL